MHVAMGLYLSDRGISARFVGDVLLAIVIRPWLTTKKEHRRNAPLASGVAEIVIIGALSRSVNI